MGASGSGLASAAGSSESPGGAPLAVRLATWGTPTSAAAKRSLSGTRGSRSSALRLATASVHSLPPRCQCACHAKRRPRTRAASRTAAVAACPPNLASPQPPNRRLHTSSSEHPVLGAPPRVLNPATPHRPGNASKTLLRDPPCQCKGQLKHSGPPPPPPPFWGSPWSAVCSHEPGNPSQTPWTGPSFHHKRAL